MDFYIGINKGITYLPRILDLTGYEVAVQDIYVPVAVLHTGIDFEIGVSTDTGLSYPHSINIQLPEITKWSSKAISDLAAALERYATVTVEDTGHVKIGANEKTTKLRLPNSLAKIFGLNTTIITNIPVTGKSVVSYDVLYERILVFCNFIRPYLMHGKYMPCIYVGAPNQHFECGHYMRTVNGQFYSLHVTFYNVFWEPITIPEESFSLMLHFRKP